LAATEGEHWQRLHPSFLIFELGAVVRRNLLPLLLGGTAATQTDMDLRWVIAVITALAVAGVLARFLSFRYRLGDQQLLIHEGVLARHRREIAWRRINHLETRDHPLARWLGVTEVQVHTEGTGAPEARLPVLSRAAVAALAARLGDTRPAGPGTPAPALLYRAGLADTLLAGATAFNLWILLAGFAVLNSTLGRSLDDSAIAGRLEAALEALRTALAPAQASNPLAFWAVAVLGTILVLFAVNLLMAFIRWWRFEVTRDDVGLWVHRGFVNRSRTRIRFDRIQALHARASPVRRLTGHLDLGAIAPRQDAEASGRATPVAAILHRQELSSLLVELYPPLAGVDLSLAPVAPFQQQHQFRRQLAVLLGLGVLLAVSSGRLWTGALPLLAAPAAWWLCGRNLAVTGYRVAAEQVLVANAGLSRHFWVVPRAQLQAVLTSASPAQRRRGLATLELDVNGAGGSGRMRVPNIPAEEAEALRDELAREVTTGRTTAQRPVPALPAAAPESF